MSFNISTFIKYFLTNTSVSNTFTKVFSPSQTEVFVGRWITPNSNSQKNINIMIDRNNEDHCGVCDDKTIANMGIKNEMKNEMKNDNDEYYRAFFM